MWRALACFLEHEFLSIIVEGDCLSLIAKLKKKEYPSTELGFLVFDILQLANGFNFCSFNHVKRAGNRVTHTLPTTSFMTLL